MMVRVSRQASESKLGRWETEKYGFLGYCHCCGQFQTVRWKKLGRAACVCGTHDSISMSGPMWLGPLHSTSELEAMRKVAVKRALTDPQPEQWIKCQSLIETMQAESDLPPYHYRLAEIGRRGKMDIPPRNMLIEQLHQAGFLATKTHISTQAIKTNAPIATCISLSR